MLLRIVRSIAFGFFASIFPLSSFAEEWVEVNIPAEAENVGYVDPYKIYIDNLQPLKSSDGSLIVFKYRSVGKSYTNDGTDSILEYTVDANCATLVVRATKVQGVQVGYKVDVPISGSAGKPFAVNVFTPLGRAVMLSCDLAYPGTSERFRGVFSDEQCRSFSDTKLYAVCKASYIKEQIGVFRARVLAVSALCGDSSIYRKAYDIAMEKALSCYGNGGCVRRAIGPTLSSIQKDVADIAFLNNSKLGIPCNSEKALTDQLQKERQREQLVEEFGESRKALAACARRAALRLDDGVSGVDVVAKSLVKSCKNEYGRFLVAALQQDYKVDEAGVVASIESDLAVELLERRSKSKRR